MSLISDFENSLPLTPKALVEWIRTLIQKVEPVGMDYQAFESIYARNRGAVISDLMSVSKFDELHAAISAGQKVEISGTNHYMTVVAASTFDVESDEFYSFTVTVIDSESKLITLGISKMLGDLFVDNKTTIALS